MNRIAFQFLHQASVLEEAERDSTTAAARLATGGTATTPTLR